MVARVGGGGAGAGPAAACEACSFLISSLTSELARRCTGCCWYAADSSSMTKFGEGAGEGRPIRDCRKVVTWWSEKRRMVVRKVSRGGAGAAAAAAAASVGGGASTDLGGVVLGRSDMVVFVCGYVCGRLCGGLEEGDGVVLWSKVVGTTKEG